MRRIAILGLGQRGKLWLKSALQSGWHVKGFDPDPAALVASRRAEWRREHAISSTVRDAELVVCCLPERLELMQKVIQRAQAEAPEACIFCVHTDFDVESVQSCATRRGQILQVAYDGATGFSLSTTKDNPADIKEEMVRTLTEIAATLSIESGPAQAADTSIDAQSA